MLREAEPISRMNYDKERHKEFENANNVKDYIGEKVFECFLARTVSIYWDAPNINEVYSKGMFCRF